MLIGGGEGFFLAWGEKVREEAFHGGPGFLDGGVSVLHVFAVVGVVWGMVVRWVDILQGDWKIYKVEIKLIDAPILKLLLANRGNSLFLMEIVPECRDDGEIRTLYEPLLLWPENPLG